MFDLDIEIDFAYQTFRWDNEAKGKAAVHCVIIGFSNVLSIKNKNKKIYKDENKAEIVDNINAYLYSGPNIIVTPQNKNKYGFEMIRGNPIHDDGNLILTDEEREEIIKEYPPAEGWIRKYIGAKEFINNTYRWILWLVDVNSFELKNSLIVMKRIEKVKEFREQAKGTTTKDAANTPYLPLSNRQPKEGKYILVPRVSSEHREYVPFGFVDYTIIASDAVIMIPNGTLLEFGILTSSTHMAWMRTVAGRLKSDYRYSSTLVYNTFPFPDITEELKNKITKTAQAILDARDNHPDTSLADLYDPLVMPADLRNAHNANDKAVWEAYGKKWEFGNELECVAYLMKLYKEMVKD